MNDSSNFDDWISRHYYVLRKRIMVSCIFDEDVFHDTYIALRAVVSDTDAVSIENEFIKLYKYTFLRSFSMEARYIHPSELFFKYLRTEAVDFDFAQDAEDSIKRIEEQAKRIDKLCRDILDKEDYEIFKLRFILSLTIRELTAYTGHSSLTIQRKLRQITELIRTHFAAIDKRRKAS